MIKTSLAVLLTAATLFAAAPVLAGAFGEGSQELREAHAEEILQQLRDTGLNVVSVEEWGELVRAFVIEADGTHSSQLFEPWSLKRVEK